MSLECVQCLCLGELVPLSGAADFRAGVVGCGRTLLKIVNSVVVQFSKLHAVLTFVIKILK